MTHAIVVLECSDDVVRNYGFVNGASVVTDDERQRRPDIQGVPRRCFGCTFELQIEAKW